MIIEEKNKEYIKNVVDYLYITKKRFTEEDLPIIFKRIYPELEKANFNMLDLIQFNSNTLENNYEKIIDLLIAKKEMIINPNKDYIYSKVDSLLDFVLDYVNENYNCTNNRENFLNELSDFEKTAVILNDFNYYLEDDRLRDWYDYYCNTDLDFINHFLCTKCNNYKYIDELETIVDTIISVKNSIAKLNNCDNWYEVDVESRLCSLEDIGYKYYEHKKDFIEYLEKYLLENIPEEYIILIKNVDIEKISI